MSSGINPCEVTHQLATAAAAGIAQLREEMAYTPMPKDDRIIALLNSAHRHLKAAKERLETVAMLTAVFDLPNTTAEEGKISDR